MLIAAVLEADDAHVHASFDVEGFGVAMAETALAALFAACVPSVGDVREVYVAKAPAAELAEEGP
eukprot:9445736-Pyramimonas_sp.AAC.1